MNVLIVGNNTSENYKLSTRICELLQAIGIDSKFYGFNYSENYFLNSLSQALDFLKVLSMEKKDSLNLLCFPNFNKDDINLLKSLFIDVIPQNLNAELFLNLLGQKKHLTNKDILVTTQHVYDTRCFYGFDDLHFCDMMWDHSGRSFPHWDWVCVLFAAVLSVFLKSSHFVLGLPTQRYYDLGSLKNKKLCRI